MTVSTSFSRSRMTIHLYGTINTWDNVLNKEIRKFKFTINTYKSINGAITYNAQIYSILQNLQKWPEVLVLNGNSNKTIDSLWFFIVKMLKKRECKGKSFKFDDEWKKEDQLHQISNMFYKKWLQLKTVAQIGLHITHDVNLLTTTIQRAYIRWMT